MRLALRDATAHLHDQLDEAMRAASGWNRPEEYARFLALQYTARSGIESWLDKNAPSDFSPPQQCPHIASDLKQLDSRTPNQIPGFSHECEGSQAHEMALLGISWVLAGSSLGNRAILHELKRTGFGDWPHSFLGDSGMVTFWNRLRPLIEEPVDDTNLDVIAGAARAAFEHFLGIASTASEAQRLPVSAKSALADTQTGLDLGQHDEAERQKVLVGKAKTCPVGQPSAAEDRSIKLPMVDAPVGSKSGLASRARNTRPHVQQGPRKKVEV